MILEGILNAFAPQKQRTQFDGYSQEEIDRIRALEAQQQAAQAGYGQQQQFYSAPTMPFFGGIDATKVSEQDLIAAGEDYKRSVPAGYASVPGLLADVVTAPPKALFDVGLRAAGKEDLAKQIEYFPLTTSSYNAARQAMDQIYGAPAPEMSPVAQDLAFGMSMYGDPLAIGSTGGRIAKNVATNIPKIAETTKQVLGQGKTAVEGLLQPPAPGELRMMIGPTGAIRREGEGAVEQRLRTAERMEAQGADPLDIYRETDMQRFPDGKWRYGEIDDEPAKLLNIGRGNPVQFQANWLAKNAGMDPAIVRDPAKVEEFISNMSKDRWDFLRKQIQDDWDYANFLGPHSKRPLSKLLDHPQLYETYPGLKNVEVVYNSEMQPNSAHFVINGDHPQGAIYFGTPSGGAENFRKTLLHEIQHYVQNAENLGSGANYSLETGRLKEFRANKKDEIKDYNYNIETARRWRDFYPKGSDDWNAWDKIYKENQQAKEEALGQIRPIRKDEDLKKKAFSNYRRSFGEVEARMTQQGGSLTARERAAVPARERFDMPESEQRPSLLDMPGYTRQNPMEGGVMDYGMRHRPPDPEVGNTLDDLSAIYPEDLYSDKGWHYYGVGGSPAQQRMDTVSANIMAKVRGNPNAEVTIYRAVPKDVDSFNAGDWVTINREYAKEHGEGPLKGDYKIISKKVRASELTTEGNSLHEQGYFPNRLMDFPMESVASPKIGSPSRVKQAKTEIPGFRSLSRDMTPEELAMVEENPQFRRMAQNIVDTSKTLPSPSEYAAVAKAGGVKRGWYADSEQAIRHIFDNPAAPDDPERFTALLAALSPQTSVQSNLKNALSTWNNWVKAGRPTDKEKILKIMGESVEGDKGVESVLDAWKNNSFRALTASDARNLMGDVGLSGPKVHSFMRNLAGVSDEVTNDAWMSKLSGVNQELFSGATKSGKGSRFVDEYGPLGVKGPGYMAQNILTRRAANLLDWQPAEIQETTWTLGKTLLDLATQPEAVRKSVLGAGQSVPENLLGLGPSSAENVLRSGLLSDEILYTTPAFGDLMKQNPYRSMLGQGGYSAEGFSLPSPQMSTPYDRLGVSAAELERTTEGKNLIRASKRLDAVQRRSDAISAVDAARKAMESASTPKEVKAAEKMMRDAQRALIKSSKELKNMTVEPAYRGLLAK